MIPHAPLRTARLLLISASLAVAVLPGDAMRAQSRAAFHDRAPELQQLVQRVAAQLEQSYGADAAEYRDRYTRLGDAIKAWNASPRTDVDFELMTGWLRAAMQASHAGSTRSLPPLPKFAELASTLPAPAAAPPQPSEKITSRPARPVRSQPPTTAPQQRKLAATEPTTTKSVRTDGSSELAPIYRQVESARRSRAGLATAAPPSIATHTENQSTESARPAQRESSPPANTTAKQTAPPARRERVNRQELPPSTQQQIASQRRRTNRPSPNRSTPTATQLDNPFRDDPLPADKPDVIPTARREYVARRPPQTVVSHKTAVNLSELQARIVGYERGLRKVEAQLMQTESLPATELTQLARTLDDLLDQREFVELYWRTLSRSERRGLPELRSAESAVELLSERILEERHALRRRGDGEETNDGRRDLLLLQEASRRLTNLGGNARPD